MAVPPTRLISPVTDLRPSSSDKRSRASSICSRDSMVDCYPKRNSRAPFAFLLPAACDLRTVWYVCPIHGNLTYRATNKNIGPASEQLFFASTLSMQSDCAAYPTLGAKGFATDSSNGSVSHWGDVPAPPNWRRSRSHCRLHRVRYLWASLHLWCVAAQSAKPNQED
jgi:hypothetical protein